MDLQDYPLSSDEDVQIIMHREVHFGGNFEIMIDYYEQGGKGICQEFEISHLQALHRMELELEENLAAVMLSGAEAERVAKAKEAYKELRDLYENPEMKNTYALLIADLILSEELEPEEEINTLIERQTVSVPALIDLVRSEDFYDPLYPGYGLAPELAAKCLGKIGDKRAITSLFELIHEGDFFGEEVAINALKMIGEPAKEFLLRILQNLPFDHDNERAAVALIQFKDDPKVAESCLLLLQKPEVRQNLALSGYLVLVCEGLQDPSSQEKFLKLADDPTTPNELRLDIQTIAKEFK